MSSYANRSGEVTLSDVAAAAGVSRATASRALNGLRVTPELRDRVLLAAETLDYTVNAQAQATARGRADVIGLLVRDVRDERDARLLSGALDAAHAAGVGVALLETRGEPDRALLSVLRSRAHRVRALIALPGSLPSSPTGATLDETEEHLARELVAFHAHGAVIHISATQGHFPGTYVLLEELVAARELALGLVARGYRRFAVVASDVHDLTGPRVRGQVVQTCTLERPSSDAFGAALAAIQDRPICVFAVDEALVRIGTSWLETNPVDAANVAVAGFVATDCAATQFGELATVTWPFEEIGSMAVELGLQDGSATERLVRVRGDTVLASTPAACRT
jgi:LacI family transcriptional regulator